MINNSGRLNALLKGEKIDRVPHLSFVLGFCAKNVGYPLASIYSDPQKNFEAQVYTKEQYGFDSEPFYGYASYGGWEFGGEIRLRDGEYEQAPSLVKFAVETGDEVEKLGLPMKLLSAEYSYDGSHLTVFFSADERVDFRQLIRVLAEKFRVRIEMRQIGARQEAGRIGGIGSCGRELCCASFIKNFVSVTTAHAKYQELSLNPQKLAGQCSKLKCCLNYELDTYLDIQKGFPAKDIPLQIEGATAYFFKMEVFKKVYWYSFSPDSIINLTQVPVERVAEIIEMNRNGNKPDRLVENEYELEKDFNNAGGDDSITRFENRKSKKKAHGKGRKKQRRYDRQN